MKIFVTGGAGFIGSNYVRWVLANTDHEIVNYDALTYAGNLSTMRDVDDSPRYSFVRGNICNPGDVESAMRGCDAVVHFAAESHVDRSIHGPDAFLETNILGTHALLKAARTVWTAQGGFAGKRLTLSQIQGTGTITSYSNYDAFDVEVFMDGKSVGASPGVSVLTGTEKPSGFTRYGAAQLRFGVLRDGELHRKFLATTCAAPLH